MSEKFKAQRSPETEPAAEPSKKKAKKNDAMQTNLFNFFAASKSSNKGAPKSNEQPATNKLENQTSHAGQDSKEANKTGGIPNLIVPQQVQMPRNAAWQSLQENTVIIRKPMNEQPRSKVAAFDLDGTLVVWSASFPGFWPSQLIHYELWSSQVFAKLRSLHDDGFKLVLFTNQGGVQRAHTGKKATLVKNIIDWLATLINRPLHAVMSTRSFKKSPDSYHKPGAKMWRVAIDYLNKRENFDVGSSFFVGDSADPNDEQGGVDFKFAQAVGTEYGGGVLKFYTPTDFFGPSDAERRKKTKDFQETAVSQPPEAALEARSALLGGYLKGPIILILCGVQGSGKSTFCQQILESTNLLKDHWVCLSQDTINKGKPGKREKVEEEARAALERGHSVVVDRMHLDPAQRKYFVEVAKSIAAPAHVVLLNPLKEVIAKRVRERTNHPGKVQGEEGARRAIQSLEKLVLPSYSEEVQLISCASTIAAVARLAELYKGVTNGCVTPEIPTEVSVADNFAIPSIALGTMGVAKKITKEVVLSVAAVGIRAIDTAPTYKNEDRVGEALAEIRPELFCIAKVPKTVTQPDLVHSELEKTLQNLRRQSVDLLLLHWPCDVISSGTLVSVWREMEACYKDGKSKALGVCNFNANALAMLLSNCSIPPVINQVERHPLLSQMELVDFCARNNIILQAHTPLGQGKDEVLADPTVTDIARESSMTPAQVVLRWNLQQGVLVVPKCRSKEHAMELVSSTILSPEQMKLLDSLDKGKRFVTPAFMYGKASFCWDIRMPRK